MKKLHTFVKTSKYDIKNSHNNRFTPYVGNDSSSEGTDVSGEQAAMG